MQPNGCRIGVLDRGVPPVPGNPDKELPFTGPWLKPNQRRSSQPGYDWLGGVSSRQGISCNSQNSKGALHIIIVLHNWMKHFIAKLLQVLHSQWLYLNFTLHDKTRGYLHLQHKKEILKEMDHLIDTNPDEIPQGSQYLLEMDFASLYNTSFERQPYWILAMNAARCAGRCAKHNSKSRGHNTVGGRQRHTNLAWFTISAEIQH
jgi:hypothetical protein